MNIDRILDVFNCNGVSYLVLGGVNFLLRHQPVLTYDIDLWIEKTDDNMARTARALTELQAEWGATEEEWRPVAQQKAGWLTRQPVFCLTSPFGAIDIFLEVKGLGEWRLSKAEAVEGKTASGIAYHGLSDRDMLRSQQALGVNERNMERIRVLEEALRQGGRRG